MNFYNQHIFNLPERCLLEQRITKAFFLKNFALNASEKKLLNAIESMEWVASLKPKTVNIPVFKNTVYIFEEVQVMVCTVPNNELNNLGKRCIDLFQKNIPYPIVLIIEDEHEFILNTCDKKINQVDATKRTIAQYHTTTTISKLYKKPEFEGFYKFLNFKELDKSNLKLTYGGYINAIVQFQSAQITGKFVAGSSKRVAQNIEAIQAIELLEKEITGLVNQLKAESQLSGRVSFNVAIQRKREEIKKLKTKLNHEHK